MKPYPFFSGMRAIGPLLILLLFANCKKEDISTPPDPSEATSKVESVGLALSEHSQTRTGNVFNGPIPYDLWSQASAQNFSADDDSYAISKKLSPGRNTIPIILQDFLFDIPSNAVIQSIVASARRFKTGKGTIADQSVFLITQINSNTRAYYGVIFLNSSLIPNTETENNYTQNGAGVGTVPDEFGNYNPYQWTPEMINNPAFGIWINNLKPSGSLVVYYDLIQITVNYTLD